VCYRRELSPLPVDNMATNINGMSGVHSNEPHTHNGISLNASVSTASYSGSGSSTDDYKNVTKHDYYNTNDADSGATSSIICDEPQSDSEISLNNSSPSAVAAIPYSGLTSINCQPQLAVSGAYLNVNKSGYYNTELNNPDSGVARDSESSSNISPSADATSYSWLASSTREPPPVAVVYDRLSRRDYYNSNDADDGMASVTICDEPHGDTENLISVARLSENKMEAVL